MLIRDTLKQSAVIRQAHQQGVEVLRRAQVQLPNVAVDLRLWPGGHDYTPFLIVSRGRSGTNLLKSLINDHPGGRCFGEVFNRYGRAGWGIPGYRRSAVCDREISRDPVDYLDRRIYRRYPRHIQAVGFKIFYYHARNSEWADVWPHLRDREGLKIIHLRRENILATHLSLVRAQKDLVWETHGQRRNADPAPTYLDYDECLAAFEATRAYEAWAEGLFEASPVLDLTYEALVAERHESLNRVFEFLNLEPQKVRSPNARQRTRPLSRSIANYAELKARFAGTEWSAFFEE